MQIDPKSKRVNKMAKNMGINPPFVQLGLVWCCVWRWLSLILLGAILVGCSTNPVTGKKELSFYSTASQIRMGEQNYFPSQQSQGGQYYLDDSLNAYVSEVGQHLVRASRTALPNAPDLPYEFVVLNNGVPNAWALPGGKIAINRGLLIELNDEAELAAVLGHEIVHAAASHSAAQMSRNTIFGLGAAAVGMASADSKYGNIINYGAQFGSAAWMARYGRDDELESDRYGMLIMSEAGYDPRGAVRLQQTFVRMSEGRNQDFISGLFASHPPSQKRVDANQAFLSELPTGGEVNRQQYQNAIAQLRKDQAAYDAQDEAIQALNEEQPGPALKALDKAVKLQPREGQFWELRGHAWSMDNETGNADKAYSTAIKKNPEYFRHWLARGVLRKELGRNSQAEDDLLRSQEILPTPTAAYYLGEIAEARGDHNSAIGYYQQAASSSGSLANSAQSKLVRYDLPANPGRYLASGILLTAKGELVAAVRNDTDFAVNQVQLRLVDVRTGNSQSYSLRGAIDPGQQSSVRTAVVDDPAHYRVDVIAAQPQ